MGITVARRVPFMVNRHPRAGFTLFELLVTLVIVAVVFAGALPSLGRLRQRAAVRAAARALVAGCRHARDVAVSRQTEARLVLDERLGTSWTEFQPLTSSAPDHRAVETYRTDFVREMNGVGWSGRAPTGVTVSMSQAARATERPSEPSASHSAGPAACILFHSDGSSNGGRVVIGDGHEGVEPKLYLVVDRITGNVHLSDKPVELHSGADEGDGD